MSMPYECSAITRITDTDPPTRTLLPDPQRETQTLSLPALRTRPSLQMRILLSPTTLIIPKLRGIICRPPRNATLVPCSISGILRVNAHTIYLLCICTDEWCKCVDVCQWLCCL